MEIHNNVKLLEVNLDIECSTKHGQHLTYLEKNKLGIFCIQNNYSWTPL